MSGILQFSRSSIFRSLNSTNKAFTPLSPIRRLTTIPGSGISRGNQYRLRLTNQTHRQLQSIDYLHTIQHRFKSSTTSKTGSSTSETNSSSGSQQKQNTQAPPKSSIWTEIKRLSRLARPEMGILIAALCCLVITSSVSMSLPLFIGKIIDTAKPANNAEQADGSESNDRVLGFLSSGAQKLKHAGDTSENEDDDVKILGLPQYQFYAALAVFFTVGASANFGRIYLLRSAGERLVARLRSRLFAKILSQDSYFFDVGPNKLGGMKTGDLISRISSDTQIISKSLSGNISDGARAMISGCVGLSMMCWVSWKLTLCMSLIFPPLILMSTVYGRRIKSLSRTIQDNLGDMTKVTEEKLNGLKTIQSFAQQTKVVHDYNQEIKKIFQSSMLEGKLSGIYYGANGFLGNITMIGLLVVGTHLIGKGDITLGDLSSFMMYAVYTGSSVFGLGNFYTELMKGIGAAERVFELIESKPKITTSLGKKVNDLCDGNLKLENVNFTYPSRPDTQVFHNLNVQIGKGEHVCFVGPSGSGKSTIAQLLLRFYDPNEGRVLVNEHNIRDLNLNFYRSSVGYVQQEPLLFSGTIRDNVTFGVTKATEEEIEHAIRLSNAYDFIMDFPDKLDTRIGGGGGAQLSGGQKQRISLARTLLKKPRILVLDEATSALDSQSEEIVMRNLTRMTSDLHDDESMTVVSIAHRLSTIQNSERIVVLNKRGEVVEDGMFDELYADPDSELNRLLKNIE